MTYVDPATPGMAQPTHTATGTWNLTMSEEFDGSVITENADRGHIRFRPDGVIWRTCYPEYMLDPATIFAGNPQQDGNSNIYTSDAVGTEASAATLTATLLPSTNNPYPQYRYKSGCISSHPSFTQTYGVFEGRMRLPSPPGHFPALWMFPKTRIIGGGQQEMDIMECKGSATEVEAGTFYAGGSGSIREKIDIGDVTAWHTYALEWTPEHKLFYIDGTLVLSRYASLGNIIPSVPFNIMANLAVYAGAADVGRLSLRTDIDWIRVWQRSDLQPGPA